MADQCTRMASNTALVRRLLEEGYGRGDVAWLAVAISDTYVGHFSQGDHYGPDGVRIEIAGIRKQLKNFSVTIDDLFACDNRVVRRFTFHGRIASESFAEASPRDVAVELRGIGIDQFQGDQFVESWVHMHAMVHGDETILRYLPPLG